MKVLKRIMIRLVMVGVASTILVICSTATSNVVSCVTEDQHWCIWHADDVGNNGGKSYVDLGGYVIEF